MENNPTRNSLIYAGAVLLFFILMAHLTVSRPDGGVFSSLGILIVSLFQLVFFVIGLAIGIAVCIAVMLLIFVAAAYLVDSRLGREIAQKTKNAAYSQLRWMLSLIAPGKFGTLQPALAYSGASSESVVLEPVVASSTSALPLRDEGKGFESVRQETSTSAQLAEVLCKVEDRLTSIEMNVQAIESNSAHFARTEHLEAMGAAVQTADARFHETWETSISPMQEQLEQMSKQNEELNAANKKLGDIAQRIVTLEQKVTNLAELPQQVTELRDEFTTASEAIPQQVADLRSEVQQQIAALKPKPAAKGRTRKKSPTQSS